MWAQFYRLRGGAYHEATGSDQVALFDGRWSRAHCESEAAAICEQRKFDGWRLARGKFSNPFFLTAAVRPAAWIKDGYDVA